MKTNFKKVRIGDLFKVLLSDGDNKPDELPVGNIPLISSGTTNHGIVGYFSSDTKIFKSKSLTLDMFGNCFVHDYSFQTVSHGRVNILIPLNKFWNIEVLLYLVASINCVTQNGIYGFSNILSKSKAEQVQITVPVTSTNELNLAYMTEYVKRTEAYLSVLGYDTIDDCKLSSADLKVLGGPVKWGGI